MTKRVSVSLLFDMDMIWYELDNWGILSLIWIWFVGQAEPGEPGRPSRTNLLCSRAGQRPEWPWRQTAGTLAEQGWLGLRTWTGPGHRIGSHIPPFVKRSISKTVIFPQYVLTYARPSFLHMRSVRNFRSFCLGHLSLWSGLANESNALVRSKIWVKQSNS